MPNYRASNNLPIYDPATDLPAVQLCCYRQSRLCGAGSLSGLWLKTTDVPASNALKQSGTCYYFDLSDATSACPGTLHSGYTTITGCGDAACAGCSCCGGSPCTYCSTWPTSVTITFTGVTVSGCSTCGGTSIDFPGGTSVNGTYTPPQNGSCSFTDTTPAASGNAYFTTNCTGGSAPIDLVVDLVRISSTQWLIQIVDAGGGFVIFSATVTAACDAGFTASNTVTSGCFGSAIGCGSGGSVTVSMC
jgi:hypothetical protein